MGASFRNVGREDNLEGMIVEIDPADLTGVFDVPSWLRDVGLRAWLLVGVILFLVGAVWLLSLTETIVLPVIAASVIAAVASPLVGWLERTPRSPSGRRRAALARDCRARRTGDVRRRRRDHGSGLECERPALGRQADDHRLAEGPRRRPGHGGEREERGELVGQLVAVGTARRPRERARGARVACLLPRPDDAQPLLPAEGRSGDPGLDRAAPRRSRAAWPARSRNGCSRRCAATSSA